MNVSSFVNAELFPAIGDKNVAVILSGGLDSTILTYLLNNVYIDGRLTAITFNYNQRHAYELECAARTCQKLNIPQKVIDIGFFGDLVSKVSALSNKKDVAVPNIKDVLGDPQPVTYVPFRNMMFLTLGLSFAEVNNASLLFIGLQAHDLYMYWDTTPEFVERFNHIAALNRQHTIQTCAPFVNLSKKEEIELALELEVPFEDTWTCYAGPDENGAACGKCPSCAERIKNFMDAGVKDPIPYAIDIPWK